jgi:microcin C transport system substrate-binding protein
MFTRRDDYWRKDYPTEKYSGNFDKIKFIAIADNPTVEYETFRRGEADLFYYTSISIENWVSDTKEQPFQKNWIRKIRVKTDGAAGAAGIYLNMRKPPFNDVRIRKAFYYLFDRQSIIDQLLYGEYEPFNSFYAGGLYENENNVRYTYDPQKAKELLEQAGWKERNSDGILVKNGKPFMLEMSIQKPIEKFVTLYQQTLRRAGIDLKLKFEDGNAIVKRVAEREFSLTWVNYGGLTFPNPESSYASRLASQNDNNNITGFADKQIDALLNRYDLAFTQAERIAIVKEIDGILANTVIAVLAWNTKGIKLGYWDKFGMPEYVLARTTQAGDHDLAIMSLWWYDAEKAATLEKARKDGTALSGDGKIMDKRYWKEHKF